MFWNSEIKGMWRPAPGRDSPVMPYSYNCDHGRWRQRGCSVEFQELGGERVFNQGGTASSDYHRHSHCNQLPRCHRQLSCHRYARYYHHPSWHRYSRCHHHPSCHRHSHGDHLCHHKKPCIINNCVFAWNSLHMVPIFCPKASLVKNVFLASTPSLTFSLWWPYILASCEKFQKQCREIFEERWIKSNIIHHLFSPLGPIEVFT